MIVFEKSVFYKLKSIIITDYEVGGIIGGKDNVISAICFDKIEPQYDVGIYRANVKVLNSILKEWQNKGIIFMGIFHSHINRVATLSKGDINTIYSLMKDMPKDIDKLYFPLVIPNDTVYLYSAEFVRDELKIKAEEFVVKGEVI